MRNTYKNIVKLQKFGENNGIPVLITDIGDYDIFNFMWDSFGIDNICSAKINTDKSFNRTMKSVKSKVLEFRKQYSHGLTCIAIGADFDNKVIRVSVASKYK